MQLPGAVTLSPLFRFEKGRAIAGAAAIRLNYGDRTNPRRAVRRALSSDLYLMDVRVEKPIAIGGTRIMPFIDLFNLTNANAEETVIVTSGSSFLRPTRIVPPFVARIGLRYTF